MKLRVAVAMSSKDGELIAVGTCPTWIDQQEYVHAAAMLWDWDYEAAIAPGVYIEVDVPDEYVVHFGARHYVLTRGLHRGGCARRVRRRPSIYFGPGLRRRSQARSCGQCLSRLCPPAPSRTGG